MTPVVEFREVPGGRWPDMTLYCILPPSGSWNLVTITKNIFEEMFLHFLTFSLSRNWYNGYIDKTKICGTLSNLTKICLIKLNKTKTYNYLYLTKLYIDICILSWFFFTIASTDTAIFVPEVNAPRDPWTDCFVHIGGRLFTFCQNVTFNQRYLRTFAEKIRMK